MERGMKHIAIVGATGRREDHTLGNISLLIEYARAGAHVRSFTDHGVFIPCNGSTTLKCRKGQQVSIFNFTAKELCSEGLLYPIYDFTNWWQGTLNECTGESFTINAEGEYLLFLNY
jgi:thiamine pyrophosphokinase